MKIKFTYVDSVTQVSVAKEPAKHGPHFPKIKGLQYLFALERKYPTEVPEFIGECDDDAEQIDGFLKVLDEAEVAHEQQAEVDSQAHRVRVDRTLRLQASDWTQLPDVNVDRTAWASYRQALKEIDQQEGFPWKVIWPVEPVTEDGKIYQVTMRQARLALLTQGLLSQVDSALANIPDETERTKAQIEWEYATGVERNAQLTLSLGTAMGLTEDQLDQLFIFAATL